MINWDKIDKKINIKKVILPLFVVILILLAFAYFDILKKHINKNIFASKTEQIYEKNEEPQFSIEKIYLCSSANAIDNTKEQNLDSLDLYQYTDIAVYINNYDEEGLTKKNTIKELYINDIELTLDSGSGKTSLVYTNILDIGKKEELKNIISSNQNIQKDRIDFKIINNNKENNQANYEEPTFYADCSNPISLKYINQLQNKYSLGKNESASFDGSILKKAGIKIEDINAKINFRINIVNNEEESFSALVSFKIPLNDIYQGTSIKRKTTIGDEYNFLTL